MTAPAQKLVFVVIASNAGGEGKTTITRLLQALWHFQGKRVAIISADPGNQAAAAAKDEDVHVLPWTLGESYAAQIVNDLSGRSVILDLGANTMTSGHPIIDLIPGLQARFAEQGYRTVALMPLSTNKLAAAEALQKLEAKIDGFETFFVRVDRDGSQNFGDGFDPARTCEVGHLPPGFQALLQQSMGAWDPIVAHPVPPYVRAADHIAEWMRRFATQPIAAGIVGAEAATALDALGRSTPPALRVTLKRLDQVTDAALAEAARKTRIVQLLDKHGYTQEGLEAAAAEWNASS